MNPIRVKLHPIFAALLGCLTALVAVNSSAQTNYPNKPIRLIIPLAAGSAVDNAARILAAKMSASLGQAIVIENQPGAAGLIGAERVARAGISLAHVPYKGATQAAVGVAAGEVPVAFQGLATVTSLINGGKLKLIAVSTPKRHPQYPNVPTVAESGLPGFEFNSWFTLMAPAGTPRDIVERLHSEVRAALADPEIRHKFDAQGLTPRGGSPDELSRATREQFERYLKLIRSAGIKAE